MPKRKRRQTPAQRAASRRNLVKARAAKGRPTAILRYGSMAKIPRTSYGNKMLTLYHRTTSANAKKIAAQGFKVDIVGGWVFASDRRTGVIKNPRKVVQFKALRRKAHSSELFPSGEQHWAVNPVDIQKGSIKVLSGRRVKR